MKQEFVTLPRELVEQALKVLEYAANDVLTGRNAATALRAALEQPHTTEQSYMGCVTSDMHELAEWLHTMYEDAKEQIAALEQPQVEQELCCESWSVNRIDALGKIVDSSGRLIATVYGSQADKIVACHNSYTHQQPKRQPLTDEQIDAIAESMPGGLDGFLKGWGWRQFARAVLEAAPQPPTTEQSSAVVEECLTDELKPRFSAHDDAERLKSVARGVSYNDHGEAVWKHTLMEIAVRLESGGYAAPQPPALEQQVEKESTCKDSLQVEQEPVAWIENVEGGIGYNPYHEAARKLPDGVRFDLYTHPQNLRCKSNQKRLATLWGYVKEQPKREPLTDEQVPSPTAGMSIAQRILHIGGRNNAAGYVEFGSIQAVEALVRQVLRDLPQHREPMTDAEIADLLIDIPVLGTGYFLRIARAIEAAHNIK